MDTSTGSASLNVIALISGGKDSMYSLLHCIANGHKVIALANLYPSHKSTGDEDASRTSTTKDVLWDEDVNSYMYQTAGYNLIPLYANALGLPLYRREILGGVEESSKTYSATGNLQDETEALIPLLTKVMRAHPTANAVSSGAILSTYQRTRIESVAVRLGLVSLSYLWQYPLLPRPQHSTLKKSAGALLQDMAKAGLDTRIVKVASGGLDDSLLWSNLMTKQVQDGIEKAVARFGGSMLGEGGEYETMVVEGPTQILIDKAFDLQMWDDWHSPMNCQRFTGIWRGRLDIAESDMRTMEGGLAFRNGAGKVVPIGDAIVEGIVAILDIWDDGFRTLQDEMRKNDSMSGDSPAMEMTIQAERLGLHLDFDELTPSDDNESSQTNLNGIHMIANETLVGNMYMISNLTASESCHTPFAQMVDINEQILAFLIRIRRSTRSIVFTTIIIQSMSDFGLISQAYGQLFKAPNPPARVTIASDLPPGVDIMASTVVSMNDRIDALHVQSRSYWAPANIGPYSQAVCAPLQSDSLPAFVFVAGQIPLVPGTMKTLVSPRYPTDPVGASYGSYGSSNQYKARCCLALQHLWRIGKEMKVEWWTGAVAFIAGEGVPGTKALTAWAAWRIMHALPLLEETDVADDDSFDVWDTTYGQHGSTDVANDEVHSLPNFEKLIFEHDEGRSLPFDRSNGTYTELQESESPRVPGFFAVEVNELPRNSEIEWQSLGVAYSQVNCNTFTVDELGIQIRTCSIASLGECVSYMAIPFVPSTEQGLRQTNILAGVGWARNVADPGTGLHVTIYTSDVPLVTAIDAQIVPCRAIWGPGGNRLTAGIVAKYVMSLATKCQSPINQ